MPTSLFPFSLTNEQQYSKAPVVRNALKERRFWKPYVLTLFRHNDTGRFLIKWFFNILKLIYGFYYTTSDHADGRQKLKI